MSWRVRLDGHLGDLELAFDIASDTPIVVIVGPNGAGKTTLLRAIAGAELPLRSSVTVGERRLDGLDPEKRRVGYVPQGYGLFPHLSVEENVAFGGDPEAALERFDLRDLRTRPVDELSGGQRQRVALARAVASKPSCLLLDEPLAALDAENRRGMRRFLAEHLRDEGLPAMVVTHDLRDVLALDGEIVAVHRGRVVQQGRADAIRAAPANAFLEELFEV